MDSSLDDINRFLHNNGIAKQARIKVITDVFDHITDATLPEPMDNFHGLTKAKAVKLVGLVKKLNIADENAETVQKVFMLLGEKVLKQSLDQFYTPLAIGKFIADVVEDGHMVLEPACGTGDLITLVKASSYEFRDISKEACELLELNLRLRGFDKGKYRVENTNSLAYETSRKFEVVASNPPFGSRTIEEDQEILRRFKLGKNKKKEQLGKLFIEYGLSQLETDGVLFIVIPMGYLTNSSDSQLRTFLLTEYRVLAILELPGNTFKRSGTGVDTAILVLQNSNMKDMDYDILISKVDKIGIDTKSKNTPPLYRLDMDGVPTNTLDNDLDTLVRQFGCFASANGIAFLKKTVVKETYQSVEKSVILSNNSFMGIQRYLSVYTSIREGIKAGPHFMLRSVIDRTKPVRKHAFQKSDVCTYLDISEIIDADYKVTNVLKGWQLPGRATYLVEENDILLSKLKGKPSYCMVGSDYSSLVVTNGVFVIRIPDEACRLSCFRYLLSESFVSQFNALAGGSIMADVKESDMMDTMLIPMFGHDELEEMRELLLHIKKAHALKSHIVLGSRSSVLP